MIGLESDYQRLHAKAVEELELVRGYLRREFKESEQLRKEVANLEAQMDFLERQLGAERWERLADRYDALAEAALRKVHGYAFTKREGAK